MNHQCPSMSNRHCVSLLIITSDALFYEYLNWDFCAFRHFFYEKHPWLPCLCLCNSPECSFLCPSTLLLTVKRSSVPILYFRLTINVGWHNFLFFSPCPFHLKNLGSWVENTQTPFNFFEILPVYLTNLRSICVLSIYIVYLFDYFKYWCSSKFCLNIDQSDLWS